MYSKIYNAFSLPVGVYKYDYHKELKNQIFNIIEKEKNLGRNFYVNGSSLNLKHLFGQSKNNLFKKYNLELKGFKDFCIEMSKSFMIDTLGFSLDGDMLCPHSWINICDNGGKQISHSHPNCVISGTYYVNFNELHSPLKFNNPRNFPNIANFGLKVSKQTPYSSNVYCPQIEEGDLLLWPSEMMHGYRENMNDSRITISMNFIPSLISNGGYDLKIIE